MAKTKAEEEAASAAKEKAGREEESTLFKIEALDDERIASVRWSGDTMCVVRRQTESNSVDAQMMGGLYQSAE